MTYDCIYYSRTFATSYALKRYISAKYQYIDEGEPFHSNIPYDEPGF